MQKGEKEKIKKGPKSKRRESEKNVLLKGKETTKGDTGKGENFEGT